MRVAFFGGTFDPIHRGHIAVAAAAADAFALDQVLFAPVGRQPLKSDAAEASFDDRIAMIEIACEDSGGRESRARFAASRLDAPHLDGTPNYTVDTLGALRKQLPEAILFVLVGADSFLDLRRWHEPERLLELADWIVVSRPEFALDESRLEPLALSNAQRRRVHLLTTVHEDVSSRELRRRLRAGDPCSGLLGPGVEDYIRTHQLYR